MSELEKVISGLEHCVSNEAFACKECPYLCFFKDDGRCINQIQADALALLKAQEPCGDAVSRQWLIEEYYRRHKGALGGALKMIEEAPSVKTAQEAIKPEVCKADEGGYYSVWYVCGSCQSPIELGDKYCWDCGKAVKWV